jgi:hypothetical protein
MNVRLSIEKGNAVLSDGTYAVRNSTDLENACADIWRRLGRAQHATPLDDQVSFNLDDLWGATMKLDKA